jgi:hypothetical protein
VFGMTNLPLRGMHKPYVPCQPVRIFLVGTLLSCCGLGAEKKPEPEGSGCPVSRLPG